MSSSGRAIARWMTSRPSAMRTTVITRRNAMFGSAPSTRQRLSSKRSRGPCSSTRQAVASAVMRSMITPPRSRRMIGLRPPVPCCQADGVSGSGGLFPEIEPFQTGKLRVSERHEIYWEESGNPEGKPVAFLHGGPGGGTEPKHRRFFDPKRYRIVLLDQRGCGRSTPHASVVENTTWDLVEDLEKLRKHLCIDRWQLFGGSWGSTLALAY